MGHAARARSRYVHNPAAVTLLFLVTIGVAFGVLAGVTRASAESKAAKELVGGAPFQAWTVLAAIALVAFGDALVAGVRELRKEPLRSASPSPPFFVAYFLALAALVVGALVGANKHAPHAPLEHWQAITTTLLCCGALGAGPWVVAVWATHALLTETRSTVGELGPASDSKATEDLDRELRALRDARRVVVRAVSRLLSLVLAAVLLSGALRAALLTGPLDETDFPASAVLLYGAFFTGVLATAVVPLMLRWRELARGLADRAYPHSVTETAEDVAARQRMLAALEVDGPLFTFPVTLTALLAPLVTSLLSVYVPQLGT